MTDRPRLVLIHGAWAGAWVWDDLLEPLDELGWDVVALDLPGDGHHGVPAPEATVADFERCIADAVADAPGAVALVGHSGGGSLVTLGAVRFPDRVTHAIWVAGFLLPDGRSFDDIDEAIAGPGARIGVGPYIEVSADGLTSTVAPDPAIAHFFHDTPPGVAAAVAARLTPQPSASHRLTTVATPSFDAMPKLYVLATDDRSVLPEAQRMMCDGVPNLTVTEIDAGHAPQLTRPRELASIMSDWLTASGAT